MNRDWEDIEPCICGVKPSVSEVFGKLTICCANKKCKLKPSTFASAGDVYDVRKIIRYWNDGIQGK